MKISAIGIDSTMTFSRPDTEDWMRTTVSVIVPNFEGAFACTVQRDELKEFTSILRELKSGIGSESECSWSNMEENIEFSFKLHEFGAIEGAYQFSSNNFFLGPT